MKTLRTAVCIISLFLASVSGLFAQANSKFMSVDDVKAGMKGIGRTVFQGTTIEDFNVEILGVLKNSLGPKQDMILGRLSGGQLEKTGVIAGMSGSPVFIDGKLIGAVAFAFPFAKEPIAGIQPIGQMVGLLDLKSMSPMAKASVTLPAIGPAEYVHNVMEQVAAGKPLHEILLPQSILNNGLPLSDASLMRIQTPILVSGVTQAALQQFMPFFSAFGLTPVQAGAGGSASPQVRTASGSAKLEPGSSVNIEMIRGDFNYSANGTVTWVDGDTVYAFGHPNLGVGSTDLPMSQGYVLTVLSNVQNSFKLAVPLDVVGSFKQDRNTGIAGKLGESAKMIPVKLTLRSSTNAVNRYSFDIANDRLLTPLLMNFAIFNAITASERSIGEMTLALSGKIHLKSNDSVNISNIISGDMNGPAIASMGAMAPVQYLMMTGFDGVAIDGIDLEIVSTERKTVAQLDGISVDKTDVKPGETINLSAFLRGTQGESVVEHYAVQIPAGLPAGPIQLLVGDGNTITSTEIRRGPAAGPKDLIQVIRELNKLRKNDRLYIKILSNEPGVMIGGEEMPSLPPSSAALLNSGRSSNRSLTGMGNSTVREYEMPQSKYVILGQRSLSLTVQP